MLIKIQPIKVYESEPENNIRQILKSLDSTSASALKRKQMCSLEKKKLLSLKLHFFILADLLHPFSIGHYILGCSI